MEYISLIRTSGIETTTGNVTPIMKNTIVKLVKTNERNVIVQHTWLEIELPISRFMKGFAKI